MASAEPASMLGWTVRLDVRGRARQDAYEVRASLYGLAPGGAEVLFTV